MLPNWPVKPVPQTWETPCCPRAARASVAAMAPETAPRLPTVAVELELAGLANGVHVEVRGTGEVGAG